MRRGPVLRAGGVLGASLCLAAMMTMPALAAPSEPAQAGALAIRAVAGQAVAGWAGAGQAGDGRSGLPGLPGPEGDCPGTHGIAAPKATPWAQQALAYASAWQLTQGAGVTVAVVDSGVDANPQFGRSGQNCWKMRTTFDSAHSATP